MHFIAVFSSGCGKAFDGGGPTETCASNGCWQVCGHLLLAGSWKLCGCIDGVDSTIFQGCCLKVMLRFPASPCQLFFISATGTPLESCGWHQPHLNQFRCHWGEKVAVLFSTGSIQWLTKGAPLLVWPGKSSGSNSCASVCVWCAFNAGRQLGINQMP